MSTERYGPMPESKQEQPPAPSAPGQPPPPGQMDLQAARFWAGRGPGGALRRNRPKYSITGDADYADPPRR
jgi:hypothetical protein